MAAQYQMILSEITEFWYEIVFYGRLKNWDDYGNIKKYSSHYVVVCWCVGLLYIPISEGSPVYYVNILATRNRKSGNLEIGVPVLGNRLFCAWLFVHFYGNLSQDLAVSAVRSSLYQYSHRNYDSACTKVNLKSDFHITGQLMETHPEYSSRIIKINACMGFVWCIIILKWRIWKGKPYMNYLTTYCSYRKNMIYMVKLSR